MLFARRFVSKSTGRGLARIVAVFVLVAALGLVASPARAQYTDAGNRQEQTVAQQLAAASVGDSVEVMLQRNRDVRPTGVIVAQDSTFLRLRTADGSTQTLQRRLIYAVTPLDEATQARLRETREDLRNRPDPNRTRLLFAPTARTHNSGELYLAGHELLVPYAALGIGGRLDLRAGASVLPNTAQFLYGGAKIGLVQQENFSLAVGALGTATTNVITVETGKDEYGGVAYALGTFGRPQGALTLGAGYLASGGTVEEQAFALLGGELRISGSRLKLLTENYLLFGSAEEGSPKSKQLFGGTPFSGGTSGIASAGVRIIGSRASVDLGAATSNNWWDATLPVLPIVTVSLSVTGGP